MPDVTFYSIREPGLTDAQVASASMAELFAGFESLGSNCEFGIVQKSQGINPPGLFRNAGFLMVEQIIKAVRSDFDGMFDAGNYTFIQQDGWQDWCLHCDLFGFGFHTTIPATALRDSEEWPAQERRVLRIHRFLRDRLRQDLQTGEKIFVFRSPEQIAHATLLQLHAAIRKYGDAALLFVRADWFDPPGTVRFEGDGLMIGTIDRLSNENPPLINYDAWEAMVHTIFTERDRVWARQPVSKIAQPRALPLKLLEAYARADWLPEDTPPALLQHACNGRLDRQVTIFSFQCNDIARGPTVTVSCAIFLPPDYPGGHIDLVCLGYPSESFAGVDPAKVGQWQHIYTTSRLPSGSHSVAVNLLAATNGPCVLYSANWRLHERVGET